MVQAHIQAVNCDCLSALPFQEVVLQEEVFPSAKCFFVSKQGDHDHDSWSCKQHINQYWPPHLSILRLPCTAALLCLLKTLCEVGLDTSSLCNFYPSFQVKLTISHFSTFQASHFCCISNVFHLSELSNLKISAIQPTVRDWLRSTSPSGSRHNPEQLEKWRIQLVWFVGQSSCQC